MKELSKEPENKDLGQHFISVFVCQKKSLPVTGRTFAINEENLKDSWLNFSARLSDSCRRFAACRFSW